jgi:hypothetical protein
VAGNEIEVAFLLMAENFRSGLVWNTFMQNPEALAAMTLVGFH